MQDHAEKLRVLKQQLVGAKYHRALKAMNFARQYHKGIRKDGVTPEFDHYPEMPGSRRKRSGLAFLIARSFGHASQARRAPAC